MGDHVHMCISIPPKYAVSNVVDYIKGKYAIKIARKFGGRQMNFGGESSGRESISCLDEAMIREYIRHQDQEGECCEQMKLGLRQPPGAAHDLTAP